MGWTSFSNSSELYFSTFLTDDNNKRYQKKDDFDGHHLAPGIDPTERLTKCPPRMTTRKM